MTAQHTPGPWTVLTTADKSRVVANARAGEGWTIAILRQGDTPEWAANARLIAAAPDLLEALEAADAVLSGRVRDLNYQVRDKVRAAIAKARGE